MSLVSVATLKTYLPEISGVAADTELSALLDRTESIISKYLGFPEIEAESGAFVNYLTAQNYTFYIDGPMFTDRSVLQLPVTPINSIASIHSDPNLVYGSSTLIESSEYILDNKLGRAIIKPNVATNGFNTAFRAIKVVCNAGYTSAPDALEHAVCVYASQLHRNKSSQGKDSAGQRGSSVKYSSKDLPFEVKQILWTMRSSSMVL
tara:strand:- start:375 stop:992 length:618 start_codon:yes stop_codon:yes gene_type:complete